MATKPDPVPDIHLIRDDDPLYLELLNLGREAKRRGYGPFGAVRWADGYRVGCVSASGKDQEMLCRDISQDELDSYVPSWCASLKWLQLIAKKINLELIPPGPPATPRTTIEGADW